MNKKHIYIAAALVCLIAANVGVGYFYYTHYYVPARQAKYIDSFMAFNQGDYSTSINSLRTLISSAPTKTEAGRLQVILASSLYARNQNGDLAESINIFKKIINDYAVAPWVRALALNNLATIVATHDLAFYKANFNDSPFNSYMPNAGSDAQKINSAYYQILKLSDETYPNSFAEYSIAGNYYAPLIANNAIPAADLEETARLIEKYVKEGNSRRDAPLYSTSSILYELLYRALAINTSGRILNNVSLEDREEAFKYVRKIAHNISPNGLSANTPISESALLRTDFYYSSFLLTNYKDARTGDIKTILSSFKNAANNPYLGSLSNIQKLPDTNYTKTQALALSAISPDFKAFLLATGVKIQ